MNCKNNTNSKEVKKCFQERFTKLTDSSPTMLLIQISNLFNTGIYFLFVYEFYCCQSDLLRESQRDVYFFQNYLFINLVLYFIIS